MYESRWPVLNVGLAHPEIELNFENATEEELRVAMDAAPNKRSYMRLGAIRALYLGMDRESVCKLYDRTDRMLRLWMTRFNTGGIDALASKPRPGRPRKIKIQKLNDLLIPVLEDPTRAGELHWTGVKIHGWLKEKLSLELGYSTLIRYLHDLGYNLRVPQPWPERQDEEKRAIFLEKIRVLQQQPEVELWFADEAGIEGDPRPRRRWTVRGGRPRVPYRGDHIRINVVGSVCPANGQCFTMIYDGVDGAVFQHYLDELAKAVPADLEKRRILIVDNASWHKSKQLNWHHFEPMFLPGYSPDFNPIERLWLRMKSDWFSDFIARSRDELVDRLSTALCHFMDHPATVASQCSFRK